MPKSKPKNAYIGFRIPTDMKHWLEQQAAQETRTMSSYMVVLMESLKQKVGSKPLTEFLDQIEEV